jgi:hypothetical protein
MVSPGGTEFCQALDTRSLAAKRREPYYQSWYRPKNYSASVRNLHEQHPPNRSAPT